MSRRARLIAALLVLIITFVLCAVSSTLLWCDYDRRVVLCLTIAAWLSPLVAGVLVESTRAMRDTD